MPSINITSTHSQIFELEDDRLVTLTLTGDAADIFGRWAGSSKKIQLRARPGGPLTTEFTFEARHLRTIKRRFRALGIDWASGQPVIRIHEDGHGLREHSIVSKTAHAKAVERARALLKNDVTLGTAREAASNLTVSAVRVQPDRRPATVKLDIAVSATIQLIPNN